MTEGSLAAEEAAALVGIRHIVSTEQGIEVAPEERPKMFDTGLMDGVSYRLRALGFLSACLKREGYAMGSLNRALAEGEERAHG